MKATKILILSLMAVLLSGCLNEKNESYTTMDNYFRNPTQIMTGLTAVITLSGPFSREETSGK